MAEIVTVWTDLPAVGARIEAAAAAVPAIVRAEILPAAEEAKRLGIIAIRDVTPVRSGALRDSTEGEVAALGDGARIDFRQPAKSKPNQDGSGGGQEYVQWVVQGRGDIYPVEKKALAGDGFGPVKHAGPAAPNPYPEEAMATLSGPLDAMLAGVGVKSITKIIAVMK